MALAEMFVIDAVTHAFDARPTNNKSGRYAERAIESFFQFQWSLIPEPYRLDRNRYFQAMSAEGLASALFVESGTDVAVYHTIPAWGVFHDLSPISVGIEMREQHPGRVLLYGAVSPLEGAKAIEDLERQAAEWDVIGVKLYPLDIIDGQLRPMRMNDEQVVYPVYEKCLELGIKMVAVHKAIPLDTAPLDYFRPEDVDYAARDFPELNFEVVHGGFAFLEETALQLARFDNAFINLEGTGTFLMKQPHAFARVLGEIMVLAGHKKIFWGTGAAAFHPAPLLEAFEHFEMPENLMRDYGYPELTREMKADILANNYADAHGLSVDRLRAAIDDDGLSRQRAAGDREPWARVADPDVAEVTS
jgi:predicted TIM-barrel fold metal-dependent hydrolase